MFWEGKTRVHGTEQFQATTDNIEFQPKLCRGQTECSKEMIRTQHCAKEWNLPRLRLRDVLRRANRACRLSTFLETKIDHVHMTKSVQQDNMDRTDTSGRSGINTFTMQGTIEREGWPRRNRNTKWSP